MTNIICVGDLSVCGKLSASLFAILDRFNVDLCTGKESGTLGGA